MFLTLDGYKIQLLHPNPHIGIQKKKRIEETGKGNKHMNRGGKYSIPLLKKLRPNTFFGPLNLTKISGLSYQFFKFQIDPFSC